MLPVKGSAITPCSTIATSVHAIQSVRSSKAHRTKSASGLVTPCIGCCNVILSMNNGAYHYPPAPTFELRLELAAHQSVRKPLCRRWTISNNNVSLLRRHLLYARLRVPVCDTEVLYSNVKL